MHPDPLRESSDDRCPGAVRLHEAADGFVARVRIPGGRVSAAQLVSLASLADAAGDGHLYLTSRGNVQLRGLASGCGQDVADGLYAAGLLPSLTHDRVRNVVASPLGGLTGHPATDEVLRDFDEALLDDPALVALSGRFLFGIDNGTGDALSLRPDVAVVLEDRDVARLAVCGEPTSVTAPLDLAADLLVGAAHRFLVLRAEHAPNAWRANELPAEALVELAPGRPGPRLDTPAPANERTFVHLRGQALGEVWGEASLRGYVAGAPLGSAPAAAWRAIAELYEPCAGDSTRPIVFTPWRSVVLVDPAAEAETTLARLGFLLDDADPLAPVTACIGAPGCARSLSDVRRDAARLAAEHLTPEHPGRRLHVVGCERRCGHPTGTHLEAVATTAGYQIQER